MSYGYPSIQESLPNKIDSLGELIAMILWECRMRGVHHHGQQNYIVSKVLESYEFADPCPD